MNHTNDTWIAPEVADAGRTLKWQQGSTEGECLGTGRLATPTMPSLHVLPESSFLHGKLGQTFSIHQHGVAESSRWCQIVSLRNFGTLSQSIRPPLPRLAPSSTPFSTPSLPPQQKKNFASALCQECRLHAASTKSSAMGGCDKKQVGVVRLCAKGQSQCLSHR